MSKIILFGAGGHARSCIDVIEGLKKYKVEFLVDNKKNLNFYPYKVLKETELKKIMGGLSEKAKVSIRNIRREANDILKKDLKEKK